MDNIEQKISLILYHDFLPESREKHAWYVENFYPFFRKKNLTHIDQFWEELNFDPFDILFDWEKKLGMNFHSHQIDLAFTECEPFLEDIIYDKMSKNYSDIILIPLFPFTRDKGYYFQLFANLLSKEKPGLLIHYIQNTHINEAVIKYVKRRFNKFKTYLESSDHQIKILNSSITKLKYDERLSLLMDLNIKKNGRVKNLILDCLACPLDFSSWHYIKKNQGRHGMMIKTVSPPLLQDPGYLDFINDLIEGELAEIKSDRTRSHN